MSELQRLEVVVRLGRCQLAQVMVLVVIRVLAHLVMVVRRDVRRLAELVVMVELRQMMQMVVLALAQVRAVGHLVVVVLREVVSLVGQRRRDGAHRRRRRQLARVRQRGGRGLAARHPQVEGPAVVARLRQRGLVRLRQLVPAHAHAAVERVVAVGAVVGQQHLAQLLRHGLRLLRRRLLHRLRRLSRLRRLRGLDRLRGLHTTTAHIRALEATLQYTTQRGV